MVRIILSGCNGKMGQVISRLVEADETTKIIAGLDLNTAKNFDYDVFCSPDECPADADVIIDFSHPSVLDGLLQFAIDKKIPAVICTTGLSEEQKEKMRQASKHIPVFFSANMSLGINLLIDLVKKAAKLLEDSFDIEIIEKHHNQKIDAPSGTALAIADGINEALSEPYEYIYDRQSIRKKRDKKEIGIHAVRGGTIVGEHEVIFAGTDEMVSITHTATSKEIFAQGAVKAAKFLAGKVPGMYDMNSLLASL